MSKQWPARDVNGLRQSRGYEHYAAGPLPKVDGPTNAKTAGESAPAERNFVDSAVRLGAAPTLATRVAQACQCSVTP